MENLMNLLYKSGGAGQPKLTKDQAIEVFKKNLLNLKPFTEGKKVKFAEVKYGRETEVMLGMEQSLPVAGKMEKAKLVGIAIAPASKDAEFSYKGAETGDQEVPIRNFTGIWKSVTGEKFTDGKYERSYSIFTGKF